MADSKPSPAEQRAKRAHIAAFIALVGSTVAIRAAAFVVDGRHSDAEHQPEPTEADLP